MQSLAAEKEESCARTGSELEEILGSLDVLDTELASVKQSRKELEESLSTNESTDRKRIDALDEEVSEVKNENHRLCELCKERNVILQSQAAKKEESLCQRRCQARSIREPISTTRGIVNYASI